MNKKIFKVVIAILVLAILIIGLALANFRQKKNINMISYDDSQIDERQILYEDILDLLSIDTNDGEIIGYITIESIGLEKALIADGSDTETIGKYVGHFKESSYLDGNVCLCSHNRGSKAAYFGKLKNLSEGDIITYITKYETKEYVVTEIKKIEETDISVLNQTEDNRITLITCVQDQRNLRLCVIGQEIL